MPSKLTADEVRRVCDPESLGFESTEGLKAAEIIIGQRRALQALQFGLEIDNSGFNIYAAGLPGTGKMTAITAFLEREAKDKKTPSDWCYVHNFQDPYRPRALELDAGMGVQLQKDMRKLAEAARAEIRKVFESDEYAAKRDEVSNAFNDRREKLFSELNQLAYNNDFALQMSSMGIALVPLKDGKLLAEEEMLALSPEEKEKMAKRREEIQDELKGALSQMKGWDKEARERIEEMDKEVAGFAVEAGFEELTCKYGGNAGVVEYLKAVQEDIVENKDMFRSSPDAQAANPFAILALTQSLRKYEVNVLVDNSQLKGAPVIIETNPTFNNLMGRLEKEAQFGALASDFTMIRPGSIHKANGGYLVIRTEDILRDPMSWDGLKRSLRERKIIIEELAERFGLMSIKSIQPEPVPLDIKVIIIGQNMYYYMFYNLDHEFPELFKVKADFDSHMDLNEENLSQYSATLCAVCHKEGLYHLDKGAVAKVIEHSSRLAEDQHKLSTRFSEIADIIREANYWARIDGKKLLGGDHITRAIEQKVYRSNLIQERIGEMISRDILKIDTEGEVVGQVNGLSVIGLGDLSFGRPSRITVSVAAGRGGLIDIEREAKLGRRLHTKGVMILSGFMAERYSGSLPLSLTARLVFEQSYEEIEGDSASSTELYALLSGLAGVPIRQGLAVTGSVNQKGEVQAIGGVSHKIEGYYEVCKSKGFSPGQGVIIPRSNCQNLMLKEEVVEAIREGRFA
ncbi:Lon protease family protein, partial [Chloroflexota bacterium]